MKKVIIVLSVVVVMLLGILLMGLKDPVPQMPEPGAWALWSSIYGDSKLSQVSFKQELTIIRLNRIVFGDKRAKTKGIVQVLNGKIHTGQEVMIKSDRWNKNGNKAIIYKIEKTTVVMPEKK